MRQIKFRAWDKSVNEMNYSGNLGAGSSADLITIHFNGMLNIQNAYGLDFGQRNNALEPPVYNFELMQFTGFTDAGGIELYVDDIIEEDGQFYIIEWDASLGMFQCINIHTLDNIALHEFDGVNTVWLQGNKYENPDLLKQQS